MSEMNGEDGLFAKLAEIAGGVKLIDHKLDASNRLQDERHERIQGDIRDLRERAVTNASGIQQLFGWKNSVEGERKGLSSAGKLAWTALGLVGGGSGVALLKMALGL